MWTGDSELIGSWKIIAISRPRMPRIARRGVERGEVDRRVRRRVRIDAARLIRPGLVDDLQDRAGGDRLARAALADDAERRAAREIAKLTSSTAWSGPVPAVSKSSERSSTSRTRHRAADFYSAHRQLTVGVGGVAQAVAEEVEGEHGDDHRERRGATARAPVATARMFCASCSSTPQRDDRRLSPRPRKTARSRRGSSPGSRGSRRR